jgi:hypothetical protein
MALSADEWLMKTSCGKVVSPGNVPGVKSRGAVRRAPV